MRANLPLFKEVDIVLIVADVEIPHAVHVLTEAVNGLIGLSCFQKL